MRNLLSFALMSATLTASAPALASADSFNAMSREMSTGSTDFYHSYNFKPRDKWSEGDNAKQFLMRLRSDCESNRRFDRQRCAQGMTILRGAFVAYELRRAVSGVVTD